MIKKLNYQKIIIVSVIFFPLVSILYMCHMYYKTPEGKKLRQFNKNMKQIKLGMTKQNVLEIMDNGPEHEFRYGSFDILYYMAPSISYVKRQLKKSELQYTTGTQLTKLADLPNIYGRVQFAFNSNHVLVAMTHIGESYKIHLLNREPVTGSHFKILEEQGLPLE